jgi:hypothetical protein
VRTQPMPPKLPLNYITALKKGHKLLCLMRSLHPTSVPHIFTLDSIGKYGYEATRYGCDEHIENHTAMLTSLGTNDYIRAVIDDADMGGDNFDILFTHGTDVVVDGVLIPKTGTHFASILNIQAGILITANNITSEVRRAVSKHLAPEEKRALPPLPALRHWSDAAYLQWSLLPNMNLPTPPLDYVSCEGIQNPDTHAIISAVLGYDCRD